MPDLRGPLGRYPENEANRGEFWIPACAGMTVFFPAGRTVTRTIVDTTALIC